jgi:hypothetical protein
MEKNKLSIRKKSLVSNFLNSILRQLKLFLLFFISKKYKKVVEKEEIDPRTLQPYILTISNNTSETIKDFKILSFLEYQNSKDLDKEGNIFIKKNEGNITIKSGISDITYNDILFQFMVQPFQVGLTYIIAFNNQEQMTKTFKITTKDAHGNTAQKTLVPTIDPYQQQTNIVAVKYNYGIDMFTDIIYSEILPNTTFSMYFYPNPTPDKYLMNIKLESKKTNFQKFVQWLKK